MMPLSFRLARLVLTVDLASPVPTTIWPAETVSERFCQPKVFLTRKLTTFHSAGLTTASTSSNKWFGNGVKQFTPRSFERSKGHSAVGYRQSEGRSGHSVGSIWEAGGRKKLYLRETRV